MAEPGRPEACRRDRRGRRRLAGDRPLRLPRALRPAHRPDRRPPRRAIREVRADRVLRPALEGPRGPGQPPQLQADGHDPVSGIGPLPGLRPPRPRRPCAGAPATPWRAASGSRGRPTPTTPRTPRPIPTPSTAGAATGGSIGGVRVEGLTDFKRGRPLGQAPGHPGRGRRPPRSRSRRPTSKARRPSGSTASTSPATRRPALTRASSPRSPTGPGDTTAPTLMGGLFPNPGFACLTYQLSAALWRSCHDRAAVAFRDAEGSRVVGRRIRRGSAPPAP